MNIEEKLYAENDIFRENEEGKEEININERIR